MQEQIRKAQEEIDKNKELLAKEREEQARLIKEKEDARFKELEEMRLKAQSAHTGYAEMQAQLEEAKRAASVIQPANRKLRKTAKDSKRSSFRATYSETPDLKSTRVL